MIAAHRRAHRRLQTVLWPLLALLMTAGLLSRRSDPRLDDWPDWLSPSESHSAARAEVGRTSTDGEPVLVGSSEDAFGTWPARLSQYSNGQIEITPLRPLDRPELLVYWISDPIEDESLPDDAHLIGRLASTRPQRFSLPEAAAGTARTTGALGRLVLYSLGHQEIVATAQLVPIPSGVAR